MHTHPIPTARKENQSNFPPLGIFWLGTYSVVSTARTAAAAPTMTNSPRQCQYCTSRHPTTGLAQEARPMEQSFTPIATPRRSGGRAAFTSPVPYTSARPPPAP